MRIITGGITAIVAMSTLSMVPVHESAYEKAEELYSAACQLVSEGSLKDALATLATALESGYPHPMDVLSDPCYAPLIADSAIRPVLRDLLKRHARQSVATMIQKDEPGERIKLRGRVELNREGGPLPGAQVQLVHAATNGKYFEEKSLFNPRLFTFLETDEDGYFEVITVRPGGYLDDSGVMESPHVHITASFVGCYTLGGEIVLSEDEDTGTKHQWATGTMTAHHSGEQGGLKTYYVTVVLDEMPVESGLIEVEPAVPDDSKP